MKGRASARSSTPSPRSGWRFRSRTARSRSTSPSRRGSSCTRCCVAADPILLFAAGVLGLCLGSFLNVCIVRLPNESPKARSLFRPPSSCPKCKHRIAWRDNIPLVSWLVLRGKCRSCGTAISRQYPIVEAVVALLRVVGAWVLKQEAMGWGDIKMMAMVGAFVGWRNVLLTVFLGAIVGTVFYLPLLVADLRRMRRHELPFGVFLAVGAAITFVAGDGLISWYLQFVRGG